MSNFKKVVSIAGQQFMQEMDLSTDAAFYRDLKGNLLMSVDSSGNCFDAAEKPFGKFKLNFKNETWYYESEDGSFVIDTDLKMLFDDVEPIVVAKLFATAIADAL